LGHAEGHAEGVEKSNKYFLELLDQGLTADEIRQRLMHRPNSP